MKDFDTLRDQVLVMGLDDWVPLLAVDMAAMKAGWNDEERRDVVLAAIQSLAEGGLVEIGELIRGAGFRPWGTSVDTSIARLRARYRVAPDDEIETSDQWWFDCWLNNTPSGDQRGQARYDADIAT